MITVIKIFYKDNDWIKDIYNYKSRIFNLLGLVLLFK